MSPSGDRIAKIIPTLFISLGGTGADISLRLRRRILMHDWGCGDTHVRLQSLEEFPIAQFIHYDLNDYFRSLSGPENFNENEKLILKMDLLKYLRTDDELDRYPHIVEWFPLTRKKLLELGIDPSRGTGNVRFMSRLYFFDKYKHLKSMIQSKMNSLLDGGVSNKAKVEKLGAEVEPASLRIVVMASTAGVTGSGSFIDMGYLAKWLAKQICQEAMVDLCLMLPGGFSSVGGERKEANSYASLMELETCMSQGPKFVTGWSSDNYPDLPRTPYHNVFLYDSVNLARKKIVKDTDLYNMAADIFFEDFASPIIAERRRAMRAVKLQYRYGPFVLPVDKAKYGSIKIRYSKAYSTFGRSFIDVQMLQRCAGVAFGQDNNTSLFNVLEDMSSAERSSLFQNCLEMAMPWVDANVKGVWAVDPDQYFCIIGVGGADLFSKRFGDEFRSVVPARTRMNHHQVRFIETGIANKLSCYVELSGIPLTSLNQLLSWRESYDKENNKIPVHIHKDRTRFLHPLALSAATLDRLAEHFKLFIQGIVLGVLKSRVNYPEDRDYCIIVSGEEFSIGNERSIRLDGLGLDHPHIIQRKVANEIERLKTPAQKVGLAVMFDFYAQCVYPFAIERSDGYEIALSGLANVMCSILRDDALKELKKKASLADIDTADLIACLKGTKIDNKWDEFNRLDIWTDEIDGSETDVYENEVGKNHRTKRILKPEFFKTGWLETRFKLGTGSSTEPIITPGPQPQQLGGPPPLPQPVQVYVAINGQQSGPFDINTLRQMNQSGQLTRDTLVWKDGMATWAAASTVAGIASIFGAVTPPLIRRGTMPPEVFEDKVRGVIYGHAIGDALGLGAEFLSRQQVRDYYPAGLNKLDQIIRDSHRQRWQCGDWTDDTDQMLCILDSLLVRGNVDVLNIACNIYQWAVGGGMGIGQTVQTVIYSPDFLKQPHCVSERVWLSSGRNAAANGGVMRTSILGVWQYGSKEAVKQNAETVCRITHYDPRCVASCVCVCLAIRSLLIGVSDLSSLIDDLEAEGSIYDSRVLEYFQKARQPEINKLSLDEPETIGYTLKALGAGIWALIHASSYRNGILTVIHEGGDADTNASVAGAILGAKYGFSEIPEEWINGLLHKNELEQRIKRLLPML